MQKPVSKWAVAMWISAVVYSIGEIVPAAIAYNQYGISDITWTQAFGPALRHVFFNGAILVGLGVLIETVDEFRWNNLSEDKRRRSQRQKAGKSLW